MVEFTFDVVQEVQIGQRVAEAGAQVGLVIGGAPNVLVGYAQIIPEGAVYGMILDLMNRSILIPRGHAVSEVSRTLELAVNASPQHAGAPGRPSHLTLLK